MAFRPQPSPWFSVPIAVTTTRCTPAFVFALLCTGCMRTATPTLTPVAVLLSPEQLAREGQSVCVPNPAADAVNALAFLRVHEPRTYQEAVFSVDPETLTALLIQTAQQAGWGIDSPRRELGGRWSVVLIHPYRWQDAYPQEYLARIAPTEAGAKIAVGEGNRYLPPELFPALQAHVRAHLVGQPVPSTEQQQSTVRISPARND